MQGSHAKQEKEVSRSGDGLWISEHLLYIRFLGGFFSLVNVLTDCQQHLLL